LFGHNLFPFCKKPKKKKAGRVESKKNAQTVFFEKMAEIC